MAKELNQIVKAYLKANGIQYKYFAKYIDCEYIKCTKWLNGKAFLSIEQLKKVHEFLDGAYRKEVHEVMEEKQ